VLAVKILGLEIPDAGPLFLAALAVHVLAGMTCVFAGALAATARKRRGRRVAHRVLCGQWPATAGVGPPTALDVLGAARCGGCAPDLVGIAPVLDRS
jgi:hypothetical protein